MISAQELYERGYFQKHNLESRAFTDSRTSPEQWDFQVRRELIPLGYSYRVIEVRNYEDVREWFETECREDAIRVAVLLRKAQGLKRVTVQ